MKKFAPFRPSRLYYPFLRRKLDSFSHSVSTHTHTHTSRAKLGLGEDKGQEKAEYKNMICQLRLALISTSRHFACPAAQVHKLYIVSPLTNILLSGPKKNLLPLQTWDLSGLGRNCVSICLPWSRKLCFPTQLACLWHIPNAAKGKGNPAKSACCLFAASIVLLRFCPNFYSAIMFAARDVLWTQREREREGPLRQSSTRGGGNGRVYLRIWGQSKVSTSSLMHLRVPETWNFKEGFVAKPIALRMSMCAQGDQLIFVDD